MSWLRARVFYSFQPDQRLGGRHQLVPLGQGWKPPRDLGHEQPSKLAADGKITSGPRASISSSRRCLVPRALGGLLGR